MNASRKYIVRKFHFSANGGGGDPIVEIVEAGSASAALRPWVGPSVTIDSPEPGRAYAMTDLTGLADSSEGRERYEWEAIGEQHMRDNVAAAGADDMMAMTYSEDLGAHFDA